MKFGLKASPAPNSLHENRFEGQGISEFGFRIVDCRFQIRRFCRGFLSNAILFSWRLAQTSHKRMRRFVKYWLPLLIWLGVIFVGSTSVMSSEHTSRYIVPFLLWLKPGMSPEAIWTILVVARKCAHVTEYAVLALLLWRALRSISTLQTKTLMVFGAALLGCALFAASDELHQTFVKSRTPSIRDVLLDTGGALFGLLIGASFTRRHPKKIGTTTHTQFVDAKR